MAPRCGWGAALAHRYHAVRLTSCYQLCSHDTVRGTIQQDDTPGADPHALSAQHARAQCAAREGLQSPGSANRRLQQDQALTLW